MCGIFGHISLEKKKKFNFPLFATLGIHNDTRGGDSCGIFIDGKSEYGTTVINKYFSDFFLDSTILGETKEFNIALGHCRKASPGMGLEPAKAQPVVLRNSKTDETRFVMIHNGTIYNYEELAKKYIPEVNIKGLSDSQVMARIFFYKGYDCLSEYQGGSVFFIVDYRQPEPQVLMFKGASRKTNASNSIITEERPFYISLGKDDLVFSSVDNFLPAFRPKIEVKTIQENTLLQYKEGKLWVIEKYDRSKVSQQKPIQVYSGGYWEGGKTIKSFSTSYISYDENENLYKSSGIPVHGLRHVERYGFCDYISTRETKDYWFFHGVPLKDKECFKLLEDYQKKTKQKVDDFTKKHQNLIRFLSIDRLYFKNGSLVMATNIFNYQIYTGVLRNLFGSYVFNYDKGKFLSRNYEMDPVEKGLTDLLESKKVYDITKLRKKLC